MAQLVGAGRWRSSAGFVSFASPCVLPLVPGYLSFVTGDAAVDAEPGRVAPT